MRTGIVFVGFALLCGCGRLGFDRIDAFTVSEASDEIEIVSPDRFRLVFDEAHAWQASGWYDLESSPSRNLVPTGRNPDDEVLMTGVQLEFGNLWWSIDLAENPVYVLTRPEPDVLVLVTKWTWPLGDTPFEVEVTHTIDTLGTWHVRANLAGSFDDSVRIEFCDSHVQPFDWIVSEDGDVSFEFVLDTPGPRPRLHVERGRGMFEDIGTDDEGTNRFFRHAPVSFPGSVQTEWTATIWPPNE